MFVRLTLTGRLGAILGGQNWAALAPELLWPLCGGRRSARPRSPTTTAGEASVSTVIVASRGKSEVQRTR
jgi:hypothetical protein